jgi:hypothetical protein
VVEQQLLDLGKQAVVARGLREADILEFRAQGARQSFDFHVDLLLRVVAIRPPSAGEEPF